MQRSSAIAWVVIVLGLLWPAPSPAQDPANDADDPAAPHRLVEVEGDHDVVAAAIHPEGHLIALAEKGNHLTITDGEGNQQSREETAERVVAVQFDMGDSPSRALADGRVTLHTGGTSTSDHDAGDEPTAFHRLPPVRRRPSPIRDLFVVATGKTAQVVAPHTGATGTYSEHRRDIVAVAAFGHDRFVTGDERGELHCWRVTNVTSARRGDDLTVEPVWEDRAHRRGVVAVAESPIGLVIASIGGDSELQIRDADGELQQTEELDADPTCLAWSAAGSRLAVGDEDGGVTLFCLDDDGRTLRREHYFETGGSDLVAVRPTPGHRVTAVDEDGGIHVWKAWCRPPTVRLSWTVGAVGPAAFMDSHGRVYIAPMPSTGEPMHFIAPDAEYTVRVRGLRTAWPESSSPAGRNGAGTSRPPATSSKATSTRSTSLPYSTGCAGPASGRRIVRLPATSRATRCARNSATAGHADRAAQPDGASWCTIEHVHNRHLPRRSR